MFLFNSFDKAKTKSQLKLAMQRIGLLRNKKMQKVEAEKKSIALLLKNQKDDPARIKAEHLIKDVATMEGLEMLQQLCDLLLARFALVETEKNCDPDIKEIVCTIIWAAPRCEVQELLEVKKQLIARYGKKLGEEATQDVKDNEWLNPRVVYKLMYRRPTDEDISKALIEVAKENGVDWTDEVAGQMEGYSAIPTVPDMPPPQPEAGAPAPTPGPGPALAAGGVCPRCGGSDPRCPQCVPAEVLANMPKQQFSPAGDPLPPPSNPAAAAPPPGGVAGWQPPPSAPPPSAPPGGWNPAPAAAPPPPPAHHTPGPAAGDLGPPPPFDPSPVDAPMPPPPAPPHGWAAAGETPPPPAPAGGCGPGAEGGPANEEGGAGGGGALPSFPSPVDAPSGGGGGGSDDPPDNDELERRFAALRGK